MSTGKSGLRKSSSGDGRLMISIMSSAKVRENCTKTPICILINYYAAQKLSDILPGSFGIIVEKVL
jgi:hypothetical protein